MQRRRFLEFLGTGAVTAGLLPPFISAATARNSKVHELQKVITGIAPTRVDDLVLAEGLKAHRLVAFADPINAEDTFGFNNDYTAFIPKGEDKGILWVNHEYPSRLFVSGYTGGQKTRMQADMELYSLGGSILHIERKDGRWELDKTADNKRINGLTEIPFNWSEPIAGKRKAMGTFQNCSGGVTPWGSILTCEENYHHCYGEVDRKTGEVDESFGTYGWSEFYPENRPEHYGWVVEVDMDTGACQKHVALGRFSHECANIIELEDGRVVVYSGDDKNSEHFYKFISSEKKSLSEGTLYVANCEAGRWEPLDISNPALAEEFESQTDILIFCRDAAKMVGATELDRPEDIEIDPVTGHVLVACTNNKPKGNYHGQIMKFMEKDGKYDALEFEFETLLAGGEETGFTCPDNLAFDKGGNLWFTCDMSGSAIGKEPYEAFGNNGMFVVPRSGPQAGEVIQVASGPVDSELTGPFFHPDGKTLFLSVQHPGEQSRSLDGLTSHWPEGGDAIPRPAVVCIEGPLLEALNG